jgi:putative DNA primase/helicase
MSESSAHKVEVGQSVVPPRNLDRNVNADDDQARSMGQFARAYAALGWLVLPLHTTLAEGGCTCGRNCGRGCGKHPRTQHGLSDATIDPDRVRDWWRAWPDANIGIATGAKSGLFVLDVDEVTGGRAALEALTALHDELPKTLTVVTGGRGLHLYFRHPGQHIANSAGKIGPGLDVRGDGGYIVAPPSLHRTCRRYGWDTERDPGRVALAEAPLWLLSIITNPATKPRSAHPLGTDELIEEGRRNAVLTSMAGSMRRRGFGESAIRAALVVENVAKCHPPLDEAEIAKIAQSVSRYAPDSDGWRKTWRGLRVREVRRA